VTAGQTSRRVAEACAVWALAAMATVVLTYPLAFGAGSYGRLQLNDGRWSIWVVAWVAHALSSAPSHLFAANIFYPYPKALALSEANLGAGILAVPAYVATRNPIAAHNTAVLSAFVLAAVATYYLVRHLCCSRAAAAAAAIAFAFCPYVFSHTAHIQLLVTAGLPLTLLTLHRFVENWTPWRAVCLGAAISAQALSCAYYGVLAAGLASLGILFFALSRGLWRDRTFLLGSAGAAAVACLILIPFFLPYLEAQRASGFARNIQDARLYSAGWGSYLASAARAHRWMLPHLGNWIEPLFPGFIVVGLGFVGAWIGMRWTDRERPRDVVVFYVALALLAFWLSTGPAGGLYSLLFHTIPIFSFFRAPSRFGVAVALALAVLMAMAIDRLVRRGTLGPIAAAALPFAVAGELMVAPLKFDRMPPVPAVYGMLSTQPRGPVAEFPFYADRHDVQFHALYMLFSTYHWQPLINGYGDNMPPGFHALAATLKSFPSAEAFSALDERSARYIVVHFPRYSAEHAAGVRDRLRAFQTRLRLLLRADTIELYEVIR
jgi:hypothetical protein